MGKTNSLNDEDLREFVELQATFAETEKSWLVDIADINQVTFDLSVKIRIKLRNCCYENRKKFWRRLRL